MTNHSPAPGLRIPPLPARDRDEEARELLAGVDVGTTQAANLFMTLVRHPGLFRRWRGLAGELFTGKLPDRDRELLILRTAWLCRAEYEWGQHRLIGAAVGISADEIERVREGPEAPAWDASDAVLLRAADELHRDTRISDDTWSMLGARYDEEQLIEVPMLVGHYTMLAFVLNSLGIQLEPGVTGFES